MVSYKRHDIDIFFNLKENYINSSTISLWELLAKNDSFDFLNYNLQEMTIIDACPTRDQDRIHMDDIIVSCVSCSKSMFVGGKKPSYLVDLLFEEETIPNTYMPKQWHEKLDKFIESHKNN